MRRYVARFLSQFCADCEHFMWPWQSRCGSRHSECQHRGSYAQWLRTRDMTDTRHPMWPCSFCRIVPDYPDTEARP